MLYINRSPQQVTHLNDLTNSLHNREYCSEASREGVATKGIGMYNSEVYRKETTSKTRRRWEDNVKIDLRLIRWGDMD
jgi:hypothetical protein